MNKQEKRAIVETHNRFALMESTREARLRSFCGCVDNKEPVKEDHTLSDNIIRFVDILAYANNTVDYVTLLTRVSEYHQAAYFEAESAKDMARKDGLVLQTEQSRIKETRRFSRILEDGPDEIRFELRGYDNELLGPPGVAVVAVEVSGRRSDGKADRAIWDTSNGVWQWLTSKLGFDEIANIQTTFTKADPKFEHIIGVLVAELKKGWTGEEGRYSSLWAYLPAFAEKCRPLYEYLGEVLPESSKNDRAQMILILFGFNTTNYYPIEPHEFVRFLDRKG